MYIDDSKSSAMAESLTSHQYKSYIVDMVHKIRTNTEVQLGKEIGNRIITGNRGTVRQGNWIITGNKHRGTIR